MSANRQALVFFFLLAFFHSGFSQLENEKIAVEYMEIAALLDETSATYEYKRDIVAVAANLDTTFVRANYEAGRLYLLTGLKDQATVFFLRVYRQSPDYKFDIEYQIGKSYQQGSEFDKAIDYYSRYKEKLTKKSSYQGKDRIPLSEVEKAIRECESKKG